MASRKYPFVTDYYYHIFNRGVNHELIFKNKIDNIRFMNLFKFYNSVEYPIRFSNMLLSLIKERNLGSIKQISKIFRYYFVFFNAESLSLIDKAKH